jgi:hypothetical protein
MRHEAGAPLELSRLGVIRAVRPSGRRVMPIDFGRHGLARCDSRI